MSKSYSPVMNVMLKAIDKASRALVRDFGEIKHLQVSKKGVADFVTKADLKSEKILIEELTAAKPEYAILSEEAGFLEGDDDKYKFIIDPLDGTRNFIHALPFFAVSIALERKIDDERSEIIAAVTSVPAMGEIYIAEKGKGAWVESHNEIKTGTARIRVSSRTNFEEAMTVVGVPEFANQDTMNVLSKFNQEKIAARSLGSSCTALAYLAAGKFDCFMKNNEKPWDLAAGLLLIQEAGGIVTDENGNEPNIYSGKMIATNGHLHKHFLSYIS